MQKRLAAPWMTLKIFGRWDEVLAIETPEYSTPYLDGILAYVKGSAFVAKGDMTQAEAESLKPFALWQPHPKWRKIGGC